MMVAMRMISRTLSIVWTIIGGLLGLYETLLPIINTLDRGTWVHFLCDISLEIVA